MKIGIIGYGNIGRTIVNAIKEGKIKCEIKGIFDIKKIDDKEFKFFSNFFEFIKQDFDLVIECASQQAVREYALEVLKNNKNLVIMSVGALLDEELLEKLKNEAKNRNLKIYIPTGAIVGIDGVKAANLGGIEEVNLITRKNPKSLPDEYKNLKDEKIIYEGNAREAVKKFPFNINVAATLSLAGIGFEKTKVKIIADPKVNENVHEIYVKGKFGEILTIAKNVPSPNNPKTSYLAALSIIALLKKLTENFEIGS
ncbi:MAG: aspartate dehydrogenase [Candidatus Altarchaeaceae archaeon]